MTREIAHFQQFSAYLEQIQPNFPPGIPQGDARFTHAYFNMSDGASARGPWNQGSGTWPKGEWTYVEDPVTTVRKTNGLTDFEQTAPETNEQRSQVEKKLGKQRYSEISKAVPKGKNQWSSYPQSELESPRKVS